MLLIYNKCFMSRNNQLWFWQQRRKEREEEKKESYEDPLDSKNHNTSKKLVRDTSLKVDKIHLKNYRWAKKES